MDIQRINHYQDNRFSQNVLNQHGAYLVGQEPYEIEITDTGRAVVRGKDRAAYQALIEAFRFHAPHIACYDDAGGNPVAEYPAPDLLELSPDQIQPSQFYIDEEKLKAVSTFVRKAEDVVIQVFPYGDRFISLDGHTRLFLAVQNAFRTVRAVVSETDESIWTFVHEAERRNILRPADMILLPHDRYTILWDQYCDSVFAGMNQNE